MSRCGITRTLCLRLSRFPQAGSTAPGESASFATIFPCRRLVQNLPFMEYRAAGNPGAAIDSGIGDDAAPSG